MKRILFPVVFLALGGLTAEAATCREYGCTRYANPNGWCAFHQTERRAYLNKKAAEAAEDRRIIRNHEALVRLHDAEDAVARSNELARLKKIERRRRKEAKVEKNKFEQPLTGLFGRTFGEAVPPGDTGFVPEMPFRGFVGYAVRSEGTNGIVRISAHTDFTDETAARRERDSVLEDLGISYGRTPYKIFTKDSSDVRALGFGAVNGMAHQQLQMTLGKTEKGWRIDLVAFVIRHPRRTLLSESEQPAD